MKIFKVVYTGDNRMYGLCVFVRANSVEEAEAVVRKESDFVAMEYTKEIQVIEASPAESDKEAVRNAALEEAAVTAWNTGMDIYDHPKNEFCKDPRNTGALCADAIRALKSQPAQQVYLIEKGDRRFKDGRWWTCQDPSVGHWASWEPAPPSDTELLRDAITAILWLDRRVPQVYKDMSHIRDTVARLEAAMRAEKEG